MALSLWFIMYSGLLTLTLVAWLMVDLLALITSFICVLLKSGFCLCIALHY